MLIESLEGRRHLTVSFDWSAVAEAQGRAGDQSYNETTTVTGGVGKTSSIRVAGTANSLTGKSSFTEIAGSVGLTIQPVTLDFKYPAPGLPIYKSIQAMNYSLDTSYRAEMSLSNSLGAIGGAWKYSLRLNFTNTKIDDFAYINLEGYGWALGQTGTAPDGSHFELSHAYNDPAATLRMTQLGTYTIEYVVEDYRFDGGSGFNDVPVKSLVNRTAFISVAIPREPDYGADLITTLSGVPSISTTSETLSLTSLAKNIGSSDAAASVTQYFLSKDQVVDSADVMIGSANVSALKAGNSTPVGISAKIPVGTTNGTYYVLAKADATNVVKESSEINNVAVAGPLNIKTISIKGLVTDVAGNGLHGILIKAGGESAASDYDGASVALDGTADGDFEVQLLTKPASATTVTFQAKKLDGTIIKFTREVSAAELADGEHDFGAVKFSDSGATIKVVDGSKIILLADQRNSKNDEVIKRDSPLVGYKRFGNLVRAVKMKLSSLGFRDAGGNLLTYGTGLWSNSSTETTNERALKLFQTLVFVTQGYNSQVFDAAAGVGKTGSRYTGAAAPGKEKVTGVVNAETLAQLNKAVGVIWTKTRPSNWLLKAGAHGWMTANASVALASVTGSHTITDAAWADGGNHADPNPAHTTHSVGLGIDMRLMGYGGEADAGNFYRALYSKSTNAISGDSTGKPLASEEYTLAQRTTDAAALKKKNPAWSLAKAEQQAEVAAYAKGRRWIVADSYNRAATKVLIQKLLALSSTRVVYFNDPSLGISSPLLQKQSGHHNHIHLGFNFSLSSYFAAGTDGTARFETIAARFNQAV